MRFLKKLFWFLVMLPLGVVLVALMVTNRHEVAFVYNPFVDHDLAQKIQLPFFYYLLGALIVGSIIGSIATWFGQGRWRKAARKRSKEAREMRKKADDLMQQVEMSKQNLPQLPAASN
jgi:uncharacterized integral membrane protein